MEVSPQAWLKAQLPIPVWFSLGKVGWVPTYVLCICIMSSLPLFLLSPKTTLEGEQGEDSSPHFIGKKRGSERGNDLPSSETHQAWMPGLLAPSLELFPSQAQAG